MVESAMLIWVFEVLTEDINRTILPVNGSITDSWEFMRPHIVAAISSARIIQAMSTLQPLINQRFHARRDKTYPI